MNHATLFRTLLAGFCLAAGAPTLAQPETPPATSEPENRDIDKVGDAAQRVAEKPFRDFNLVKDKIPPALQAIVDAPYSLKGLKTCRQLGAEVRVLTNILGPDVDSGVAAKKGQNAGEFALGLGESVAGSLIPGAGLIRLISGADAAQKRAQAAVLAGQIRRAYVKGTARAKGCKV